MGMMNNHAVDNGDVEVYTSYYTLEYTYNCAPYPDDTPIKSLDYDELDHIL